MVQRQQSSLESSQELPHSVFKLFAIVVLYKTAPSDSSSLQTLLTSAANAPDWVQLKISVWDNTPGGQEIESLPGEVIYLSAPHNPGLATAYNHASQLAQAEGFDWLLTLDQNSILPANFVTRAAELAGQIDPATAVAAIVPQVTANGSVISPFEFFLGAFPRWFPVGYVGLSRKAAYADNSGSILRISALRSMGGYDPAFPLDLSDTNLFHQFHLAHNNVFIAGDLQVHLDSAPLNKHAQMSAERYEESLLDDCAFWDLYMSRAARFARLLQYAVTACKHSFRPQKAPFHRQALLELKRRFFTSRSQRITEWKEFAARRCDSIDLRAYALGLTTETTSQQSSQLSVSIPRK